MSDETEVTPETTEAPEVNGPTFDAKDVAANPEKYGFRWNFRALHRVHKGQKVLLREKAPHFEVPPELFDLFVRNFPDAVRSSFTTSLVVQGQEPARKLIQQNPRIPNSEIQEKLVRSVLFNIMTRSRGTTKVYVGADDVEYPTAEAARASYTANIPKPPTALEQAQELVATLVELGISVKKATEKAREKFPDAFPVEPQQ